MDVRKTTTTAGAHLETWTSDPLATTACLALTARLENTLGLRPEERTEGWMDECMAIGID